LKHPNETFAIYVLKQLKHMQHTSETLVKTLENARKAIAKYMQHPDKTHATYV
jgi:biotin operon repressor